jgi:Xaa-Pro aminopeptidase
MAYQVERINTPVSTGELERRWGAVRAAMREQKIDALLMQNNNDHMGGYVKYFTDLPATFGYPVTVVFPREDRMSVVSQGAIGAVSELPPEGDGLRRGVKASMTTSSFAGAPYSLIYDAQLAERALAPYAGGTIGLVGLGTLPVSLVDYLKQGKLSKARWMDASDLVDQVKVIKSDEELALIRRTAAVQDAAMEAAFAAIRPGMRESEVAAVAEHAVHDGGGEQGIYLCSSMPGKVAPGQAVWQANRHLQNRVLRDGDVFTLLVETNGPGGQYTELGRTCVLGKAPQALQDEFAFLLESRNQTLARLVPGASCKEIWDAHNRYMREHGKPEEQRLYCHGQGYDLVERPLVRFDEPMPIARNMNIACHPNYLAQGFFNSITDNYLVGERGVTERLHKFPENIVELG